MSPKPIGVVGGAGPFAGLCLLDRLFSISQSKYGCTNDKDFPLVILYSFPFSDMLSENRDELRVREELSYSLDHLTVSGAQLLAIACNTLHAFVSPKKNLITLPEVTQSALTAKPLVLCTSTSREAEIHKQVFDCDYPSQKTQKEVDEIIRRILAGVDVTLELQGLITNASQETILLGCTELSLYARKLKGKTIIDPLDLLADKLLEESFKNNLNSRSPL